MAISFGLHRCPIGIYQELTSVTVAVPLQKHPWSREESLPGGSSGNRNDCQGRQAQTSFDISGRLNGIVQIFEKQRQCHTEEQGQNKRHCHALHSSWANRAFGL